MTGADDIKAQLAADIQHLENAWFVSPRLLRMILEFLGDHAKVLAQRNGCAPALLVATQHAVAEKIAATDSRQRQRQGSVAAEIVASAYEPEVGTDEAAAALGITDSGVRWHITRGNLVSRKVGRQHMVTVRSLEGLKLRLDERKGA